MASRAVVRIVEQKILSRIYDHMAGISGMRTDYAFGFERRGDAVCMDDRMPLVLGYIVSLYLDKSIQEATDGYIDKISGEVTINILNQIKRDGWKPKFFAAAFDKTVIPGKEFYTSLLCWGRA